MSQFSDTIGNKDEFDLLSIHTLADRMQMQKNGKSVPQICRDINVKHKTQQNVVESILKVEKNENGTDIALVKRIEYPTPASEVAKNVIQKNSEKEFKNETSNPHSTSVLGKRKKSTHTIENTETDSKPVVKMYVGRIQRAKTWPVVPAVDTKNVNVTSGAPNKFDGRPIRLDFSPLYLRPVNDSGAATIEGFWQGGKVYPHLKHLDASGQLTDKWREFRDKEYMYTKGDPPKGRRRPPGLKSKEFVMKPDGKRRWKYHAPAFAVYDKEESVRLPYIEARKKAYVPAYYNAVIQTDSFKSLKKLWDSQNQSIMLLDFDGPNNENQFVEITVEELRQRINDHRQPFGHGYVLAAALLGIKPEEFINN